MSSLLEDLDELMWPIKLKFDTALPPAQWAEFFEWCNRTVGPDNWRSEQNFVWLRKEEHATLLMLRWS